MCVYYVVDSDKIGGMGVDIMDDQGILYQVLIEWSYLLMIRGG